VQDEVLPEEGGLEDLALGDPAEIERNVVKRRDVDHRIVVQHDDVTLLPVHVLPADHPLPPPGRHGEEDADQNARQFVHHAAALIERIAHDQSDGRQHHEKGAEEDQKDIVNCAYHKNQFLRPGRRTPPHPSGRRIGRKTA